jgi:hypothetical protein
VKANVPANAGTLSAQRGRNYKVRDFFDSE